MVAECQYFVRRFTRDGLYLYIPVAAQSPSLSFLLFPRTVNHSEENVITREMDECEVKAKLKGGSVQLPRIQVGALLLCSERQVTNIFSISLGFA